MEVTFKGNGLVWDKEKNKPLCKFNKQGEYKTSDKKEIEVLKDIFESDIDLSKIEPEETKTDITKPEVMAMLDELEIKYNPRDKKEKLIKLLEE